VVAGIAAMPAYDWTLLANHGGEDVEAGLVNLFQRFSHTRRCLERISSLKARQRNIQAPIESNAWMTTFRPVATSLR
jgi:hypothetical protein